LNSRAISPGLKGAHSTEFDPRTPHPVIALITEWKTSEGKIEVRNAQGDLGGTMRLGGYTCHLQPGSRSHTLYAKDKIIERHRHRYEFNNNYREVLQQHGLVIAGTSEDGSLVEVIELPDHPWFVGVQFHPNSPPRRATGIRFSPVIFKQRATVVLHLPPNRQQHMKLCGFEVGLDKPFFLIGRTVLIESKGAGARHGGRLKEITTRLGIPFIYKSSFDKANRSSGKSFRGLGMDMASRFSRACVRPSAYRCSPTCTTSHEIAPVAAVVDVLQTPAFLCRSDGFYPGSRRLRQAGEHQEGSVPRARDMKNVVDKANEAGGKGRIMVCERGVSFGYNNLVSDMRSLAIMRDTGCPVVFDATQLGAVAGGQGTKSGDSANSYRCWHVPPSPRASPVFLWRLTRIRRRHCPTVRTPGRSATWKRC